MVLLELTAIVCSCHPGATPGIDYHTPAPFQYRPAGRVVIRNSADLWHVTALASPSNPKWETH